MEPGPGGSGDDLRGQCAVCLRQPQRRDRADQAAIRRPVFTERLLATLAARGVKIGIATSIRKADWEEARIFPPPQEPPLPLSESQLTRLALFSSHATQGR
jgi:hypothetical protein